MLALVLLALIAFPASALALDFQDAGAALPVVDGASAAWGDYDNDGDLDLLLAGRDVTVTGEYLATVYRNSGGSNPTFQEAVRVPGSYTGSLAWGDYDNDGNLDILVEGTLLEGCAVTWAYHNEGGPDPSFRYVPAGLPSLYEGSLAWGDYDNDGDLDVLVTGTLYYNPITSLAAVYRNDGGATPAFSDVGAGLPAVRLGSGAWGDYDSDGDLDILLVGTGVTDLYRNSGGTDPTFTAIGAPLASLGVGASASFGDYEGDGDLDILLTGQDGASNGRAIVYRRANGFYSQVRIVDAGRYGAGAWADYDNDGDLDFLAAGHNVFAGSLARVYRNEGGPFPLFSDILAALPGAGADRTAAAWGDYDNDGDLDFLLAGKGEFTSAMTRLYRNDTATPNTPPTAPTNLEVNVVGTRAFFSWEAASDAETPAAGLSYNLRVGTSPGTGDIVSPMADGTGYRRVPALGNTNNRTSWEIELPSAGPYYWSVQAVDGAFAGSPFAPEGSTEPTAAAILSPATREGLTRAPNPFSGATTIRFSQAAPGPVSLRIYDVTGRRIRSLDDGSLPAGSFERTWDGRDDAGRPVAAGTYFARLRTRQSERSEKVTLVR